MSELLASHIQSIYSGPNSSNSSLRRGLSIAVEPVPVHEPSAAPAAKDQVESNSSGTSQLIDYDHPPDEHTLREMLSKDDYAAVSGEVQRIMKHPSFQKHVQFMLVHVVEPGTDWSFGDEETSDPFEDVLAFIMWLHNQLPEQKKLAAEKAEKEKHEMQPNQTQQAAPHSASAEVLKMPVESQEQKGDNNEALVQVAVPVEPNNPTPPEPPHEIQAGTQPTIEEHVAEDCGRSDKKEMEIQPPGPPEPEGPPDNIPKSQSEPEPQRKEAEANEGKAVGMPGMLNEVTTSSTSGPPATEIMEMGDKRDGQSKSNSVDADGDGAPESTAAKRQRCDNTAPEPSSVKRKASKATWLDIGNH